MMCVILPVDEQDLEKCESPAFGFGVQLVFSLKAQQKGKLLIFEYISISMSYEKHHTI